MIDQWMIEVGITVKSIREDESKGKVGIVAAFHASSVDYAAVDFPFDRWSGQHNCNGTLSTKTGWYIHKSLLKVVPVPMLQEPSFSLEEINWFTHAER